MNGTERAPLRVAVYGGVGSADQAALTALGVSVRFELEDIDTGEDGPQLELMELYSKMAEREAEALARCCGCGCCTGWPTIRGRRFP